MCAHTHSCARASVQTMLIRARHAWAQDDAIFMCCFCLVSLPLLLVSVAQDFLAFILSHMHRDFRNEPQINTRCVRELTHCCVFAQKIHAKLNYVFMHAEPAEQHKYRFWLGWFIIGDRVVRACWCWRSLPWEYHLICNVMLSCSHSLPMAWQTLQTMPEQ